MGHKWFETVEIARQRAERILPPSVAGALRAGSEAGVTLDDNLAAFRELGFAPTVADKQVERVQSTTVMGQDLSLPVMVSPTGVQMVHPEAELGMARAARSRGTAIGLSSFGSTPVELVVAANPATFFQLYWCGSRDQMAARLERAKRAGVVGLIVTLDWSFSHGRDWGSPTIPAAVGLRTVARFSPELIRRPRYVLRYAKRGRLPALGVPNMVAEGARIPGFFEAYQEWMQTPPPSWADLAWLRDQWEGPFMLKGVMRVDDALRAADLGFTALSVSNHGGNNLDTTAAPVRVLPGIADAVGGQLEVVLDGGIRRGSDVVKALALGARAVMVGRASLWALAEGGQAGVENLIDVLRGGIDSALLGLGKCGIDDLHADDVVRPAGFDRSTSVNAKHTCCCMS